MFLLVICVSLLALSLHLYTPPVSAARLGREHHDALPFGAERQTLTVSAVHAVHGAAASADAKRAQNLSASSSLAADLEPQESNGESHKGQATLERPSQDKQAVKQQDHGFFTGGFKRLTQDRQFCLKLSCCVGGLLLLLVVFLEFLCWVRPAEFHEETDLSKDIPKSTEYSGDGISEPLWQRVTLSEDVRMHINGETGAQMEHARKSKAQGEQDTTVDQPWEIDHSLRLRAVDKYVMVMSAVWIIPKILVFGLPLVILCVPCYLNVKLYSVFMSQPCDYVDRKKWSFIFFIELFGRLLLFLPRCFFFMLLMLDYLFYYLFSVPVFLFTCCCGRHGWEGYKKSQAAIEPYRYGPGFRWSDILVCSIGQVVRNGPFECAKCLAGTALLLPWMKYFINANPFLYRLDERFVQQISTSMEDVGLHECVDTARRIISRSKQGSDLAHDIDAWKFIPHYPFPPPSRRWSMGMQHVGKYFQLFTHVTHAISECNGSTEFFIRSNSVASPVYRVMLWYDNPYHFFTGYVEASISTGLPSQPNKLHGGEHPMWLVTSHSPLLSERTSKTGAGMIDKFFDKWLPTFVDTVRALVRGPEIAVAMHQEVVSQDGFSPPKPMEPLGEEARQKLLESLPPAKTMEHDKFGSFNSDVKVK